MVDEIMQRNGARMQQAGMLIQSCLGGAEKNCQALEALIKAYKADRERLQKAGTQYQGMAASLYNPCFQIPRGLGPQAPETKLGNRLGCPKL